MGRAKMNTGVCAFEGCYALAFCKKLCRTHYWQQYVGRDLTPRHPRTPHVSVKARFDRWWRLDPATGCWNWEGAMHTHSGYGQFWYSGALGAVKASRAAWMLYKGPIPDDVWHVYGTYQVLHTCDNKRCVRPAHLFLGTQRENIQDHIRKHGHPNKGIVAVGEAHPCAKVNADIVREIRQKKASQAVLGRTFGISRGTVGEIQRREIWKHVEDHPMPESPVLPSWRYHVSGASRVVATVDELQALEAGEWFASPQEAAEAAARAAPAEGEDESPAPSRRHR